MPVFFLRGSEIKQTILKVRISKKRARFAKELVQLSAIIFCLCIFLGMFAGVKIFVCKQDTPKKTIGQCLKSGWKK